jgi:N-acetylglucosamine-6-phosphate deacetylase
MIQGFKDSLIAVDGEKDFVRTSLSLKNGLIASVGSGEGVTLPEGLFLVPGFIDEHIHGSDGVDSMDKDPQSVRKIARSILQDGVTSFCPTTMTMGEGDIEIALQNIAQAKREQKKDSARILGVHLEGPFISPTFKGAQEEKNIRSCDLALLEKFYSLCPSIKEITFAYEENGEAILPFLKKHQIVASIGHSNCDPELLKKGIEEGISCSTHTYNAMRRFTHRDVGIVGVVLLDPRVDCELIADLIHVCPDAIRLLAKCKGLDHVILITDSMEAKHLPEGKYALGGQDVYVKDGAARLADGTLAGSVLTLNKAVKNVKDVLGISLREAVDLASKNPAKNLHEEHHLGSIQKGFAGDFAIIDENLNVYATIREGEIAYKKEDYPWLRG